MKRRDHDSSYVSFEGVIPEGSYGAGTVSIWDNGFYELKEENAGKLVFVLHGAKMKGEYCLLKFKKQGKKSLWLIFKTKRKEGRGRRAGEGREVNESMNP